MEPIFDLDVEHMSAVFVSDNGHSKICCQCHTCSTFFANAAIQAMHQHASVNNQCLTCLRLSMKLS